MREEVESLVLLVIAGWAPIVPVHLQLDCVEKKAQCESELEKEKEMEEEQMKKKLMMMECLGLDVVVVEFEEVEFWVCQRDREFLWSFQSGHAIEACGV